MGCCESIAELRGRDTGPLFSEWEKNSTQESHSVASSKNSNVCVDWEKLLRSLHVTNPEQIPAEIELYVKGLASSKYWATQVEKTHVVVKTLPGSEYSQKFPVCLAYVDFACTIPAGEVLDLLLNPTLRTNWDQSLYSFEVLGSNVLRVIKNFPFKNREFLMNFSVPKHADHATAVLYNIGRELSNTSHVKGKCLFCVYKVLERPSTTIFMCMQQLNDKQRNSPQTVKRTALEMSLWADSLRRAVKHHLKSMKMY